MHKYSRLKVGCTDDDSSNPDDLDVILIIFISKFWPVLARCLKSHNTPAMFQEIQPFYRCHIFCYIVHHNILIWKKHKILNKNVKSDTQATGQIHYGLWLNVNLD